MAGYSLTSEQEAVVHHPLGKHARVLAVAGSGKTTTMAHRVKHLVQDVGVSPARICILMFNRLAREQFQAKLRELLPERMCPAVNTFHSYAYRLIGKAVERRWVPGILQVWVGDLEERTRRTVHQAIQNLTRVDDALDPENIDVDEVLEAIGLWKGALIPPERAGYRGDAFIPLVYKEFELLRGEANAITFDDFIPLAVEILEADQQSERELVNRFDFLIVDEYQDVNYGQQRLIELLAGSRADIMVVGDDDQTIYEWRGARPSYILNFGEVFGNKPYVDYTLSRSFRFGPVIAQCAQNVIEFNSRRVLKPIVAHNMGLPTQVHIIAYKFGQEFDVNKELAEQVVQLVKQHNDPKNIIVLGRMYAQLNSLEAEFLARGIPYRVVGRSPFFKRREIQALLDYVRLALEFDSPVNQRIESLLLSIANMPNRKISRKYLKAAMQNAYHAGQSTRYALELLVTDPQSPLTKKQRESTEELLNVLDRLNEILLSPEGQDAGIVLNWLVQTVDFKGHFENYYGKGEASEDRRRSVDQFCVYAQQLKMAVPEFLVHIDSLDTTRGVPEDEQIVMTTVFRTKGLEYDYVFIPNCEEGYMPVLFGSPNLIYDLQGIVEEPAQSQVIENERRLFYVAITRARKAVFIGVSQARSQGVTANGGQVSRFVHEMEYTPTFEVISALQRVVEGHADAKQALLKAVVKHGANKRVINSLLNEYLPSVGDVALLQEVKRLGAMKPEVKFEYPEPLESVQAQRQSSVMNSPNRRRWWENDEL